MGDAVIGLRQLQHMLEIVGKDGEAAPVRQAVGMERHHGAAHDGEDAERGPCAEQRQQILPQRRLSAPLCAGERVDDLAEQHRLGELRDRQREIGDGQEPAAASAPSRAAPTPGYTGERVS